MRRFALVQLEVAELSAVTEAIRAHPGARLLVFGVGNDSRYWRQVNLGGTTDFIEDDLAWIERIKRTDPRLSIHPVRYETSITDWRALLDQPDRLALDVPGIAPGAAWDVILVDAPAGFDDTTTGRMKSIYFASTHAPGGDVFVHDCHREAEIAYCDRYLGADNFVVEVSWLLRHYRMPPAP